MSIFEIPYPKYMLGENEMYDIHCHILPRVDDGPSTIEEAVEIARAAEQAGIEAIVCTPHYIDDSYKSGRECNLILLNSLKKAIELKSIGIKLYLGNEIYITPDIINLIDTYKISTLNNSRYILIEMPIYCKPLFTDDIIFKLKLRGLVPVIAHPERYEWVIKNPKELSSIVHKGCLTQLNTASISGHYGDRVRKVAKTLMIENYIHLFGSDSHSSNRIFNNYKTDLLLLKKNASEYKVQQIIQNNEAVINDQVIRTFL